MFFGVCVWGFEGYRVLFFRCHQQVSYTSCNNSNIDVHKTCKMMGIWISKNILATFFLDLFRIMVEHSERKSASLCIMSLRLAIFCLHFFKSKTLSVLLFFADSDGNHRT